MNQMELNPEIIERIAADVFWTYAFDNGRNETIDSIMQSTSSPVWSLEKAQKEINTYFNMEFNGVLSDIAKKSLAIACYEQVLEVILRHIREEKNIMGPIYVEDFKDCKEGNFKFLHLLRELSKDSDENCGYKIVTQGDFTHIGTLLLRTPLPSVVLLKGNHSSFQSPIIVEDTKKALTFHKTLIFSPREITELPPNSQQYSYFLSGTFHLPTKRPIDHVWYKLLPNTIGICKEAVFSLPHNKRSSFSIHNGNESSLWHKFKEKWNRK